MPTLTLAQKSALADLGNGLDQPWSPGQYRERLEANYGHWRDLLHELVGLHLEQHGVKVDEQLVICSHLIDTGQRYSWVREDLELRLKPRRPYVVAAADIPL